MEAGPNTVGEMLMNDDYRSRGEQEADDEMSEVLNDALGGTPSSSELEQMVHALGVRKQRLQSDLDLAETEELRGELRSQMAQVDEHIAVLAEEARINRFVEDAVRVGIEMRKMSDG
jgi:hypothetical protein